MMASKARVACLAAMLWAVSIGLCGCTAHLVSDYDPVTDRSVSDLYRSIDALLTRMEELSIEPLSPNDAHASCNPDEFADDYREIGSQLRLLIVRNAARPDNSLTNDQLLLLSKNIDAVRQLQRVRYERAKGNSEDRSGGCLPAEEIGPIRRSLDQAVTAILKLELAKRDFRTKE
ncbi:MAG TPA: hypothetical protein VFS24_14445 [Steroidobacteraceae bacterium]|nr:hypothetical protein [Steroidobacteraceae bacterium]